MILKKLTKSLSLNRKRIHTLSLRRQYHMTFSFFKAFSALPNELIIAILRDIYPPEAFHPYDPYTNRGTVSFWDTVLKADSLMGSISQIDERFQQVTEEILDELAAATSMRAPKGDTWKTIEGMHWRYREDAEWQWGYGALVRYAS